MINRLIFTVLLCALKLNAQETPIKVVTEDLPNRLAFYAINENDDDFDVIFNISGSNFRQSQATPRLTRVPGASKVHLKTIILTRGKNPDFSYQLTVNDSLSPRALKKEYTSIKVKPKKSITVYLSEVCTSCDSSIGALERSKYIFNAHRLGENPEIKEQLKSAFPISIHSMATPIINLGGRLYTRIESYEQLLTELNKD